MTVNYLSFSIKTTDSVPFFKDITRVKIFFSKIRKLKLLIYRLDLKVSNTFFVPCDLRKTSDKNNRYFVI